MTWVVPPPRRFDPAVPEWMDRPGNDPALLRADLTVLASINRFLGGQAIPLHYLRRWPRPASILDLATGGGDIPRALARWARREQIPLRITAVDGNPEILAIARERSRDYPEISFEQQNLLALPYGVGSFDVVLNSLTLHHFSDDQAVAILRRIGQIARVGYVVNDLRRRHLTIWVSRLLARTIIRNPIAKFDAPASCERAFSVGEWRELVRRAALPAARVDGWRGYRLVIVGGP